MRVAALPFFVFAVLGISPLPVQAGGSVCAGRDEFVAKLDKDYHERPAAMGVTGEGSLIELLTGENGSWTLIVTLPDGTSCLIAAGKNWENLPVRLTGSGV